MDNMINYWNQNMMKETNIEFIYSTPQMYIDAVNKDPIDWPCRYDDMFPYADSDVSYWTGYFTSRANDKKYIRDASHTLHSSNKLFALAGIKQTTSDADVQQMVDAKEWMMDVVGIVQHHDAVTGTAKQHVANDYMNRIFEGIQNTNEAYAKIIGQLANMEGMEPQDWSWCFRQNGTYVDCPISGWDKAQHYKMVVASHNPSNIPVTEL